MQPKVFFIHTISGLTDTFSRLFAEHVGEADITHISDESLIQRALRAEGLTPAIYRRVCEHVVGAEEAGADFIQLTCSSVSPCVDVARHLVAVPVLKIDDPVVARAVRAYDTIGVIATASSTLKPSTELVRSTARESGRDVTVVPVLCEGAYDALFEGDVEKHDAIVSSDLVELAGRCDAVLLAQASMARVASALDEGEVSVPVLSSPGPAMEHLAGLVAEWRAARSAEGEEGP
ncbi:MAG: aspartate/glutamate racemase family protein [Candidatus Brocadiaceae bacterium]|jgi:Asp/Glu/hydantoin racemase